MSSQFYRPYDSGTESDSESDFSERSSDLLSDLDSSDSSEYASLVSPGLEPGATLSTAPGQTAGGPDFRALAGALNQSIAGPNFDSSGSDLDNRVPQLGFPVSRGFPTFKGYEIPPDPSGNKLKTTTQNITSVIMLDSRDRDRKVFPQPTNLTLRLPRQYQNVTNFSMVQIKLLSSFFYFRNDKQNTDISILELNRTITEQGKTIPNIIKTFIRQGTYDINSLLTELTTQLNVAPSFTISRMDFRTLPPALQQLEISR